MDHRLQLEILPQPNDTTCGPTCLHAVYRYLGEELPLHQVIAETQALQEGGTLAVMLGCHALRRGFDVAIDTFNLQVFDPTWFDASGEMRNCDLMILKLEQQAKEKNQISTAFGTNMRTSPRLRIMSLTMEEATAVYFGSHGIKTVSMPLAIALFI